MKIQIELNAFELEAILGNAADYGVPWARWNVPLTRVIHPTDYRIPIFDREKARKVVLVPATGGGEAWEWQGPVLGELTHTGLAQAATRWAELVHTGTLSARWLAELIAHPTALDGPRCDMFLQLAVFGDVRYG